MALGRKAFGGRSCEAGRRADAGVGNLGAPTCVRGVTCVGVVDQHRDAVIPPQLGFDGGKVFGACQIGHDDLDPGTAGPQTLRDPLQRRAVGRDQNQVAAPERQALGVGRAEAALGAGDERRAVQIGRRGGHGAISGRSSVRTG